MVRIRFNELNVNEVTKSSGIYSGDNRQLGWRAEAKTNQGFGVIEGDHNEATDLIHIVVHSDRTKKT